MKSILMIFKNRNYSLLFFVSFTSQMGNIIGIAAFMLYFRLSKYASMQEVVDETAAYEKSASL